MHCAAAGSSRWYIAVPIHHSCLAPHAGRTAGSAARPRGGGGQAAAAAAPACAPPPAQEPAGATRRGSASPAPRAFTAAARLGKPPSPPALPGVVGADAVQGALTTARCSKSQPLQAQRIQVCKRSACGVDDTPTRLQDCPGHPQRTCTHRGNWSIVSLPASLCRIRIRQPLCSIDVLEIIMAGSLLTAVATQRLCRTDASRTLHHVAQASNSSQAADRADAAAAASTAAAARPQSRWDCLARSFLQGVDIAQCLLSNSN